MRGGGISTYMSVAAATPWLAIVTAAGRPPHRTTSPPPPLEPLEPRDTVPLALLPLESLRRDLSDGLWKLNTLSEQRQDLGKVSLAHRRGFNSLHLSFDRNIIS